MGVQQSDVEGGRLRYRIEVAGQLPAEWKDRFEADALIPSGRNTLLHIRVRDQAELIGRLRRVHDLNLQLVALLRIDPEGE